MTAHVAPAVLENQEADTHAGAATPATASSTVAELETALKTMGATVERLSAEKAELVAFIVKIHNQVLFEDYTRRWVNADETRAILTKMVSK